MHKLLLEEFQQVFLGLHHLAKRIVRARHLVRTASMRCTMMPFAHTLHLSGCSANASSRYRRRTAAASHPMRNCGHQVTKGAKCVRPAHLPAACRNRCATQAPSPPRSRLPRLAAPALPCRSPCRCPAAAAQSHWRACACAPGVVAAAVPVWLASQTPTAPVVVPTCV